MTETSAGRAEFAALNQSFYSADPVRYYRSRLLLVMLAAGKPDGLESLLNAGVEYEGLTFGPDQVRWPHAGEDPDELAFLIIESEQLLHQVTETLLRLFLAHRNHPPVPWLEVASLTRFDKFKRLASELATDPWAGPVRQQASAVFLGRSWTSTPDPDDAVLAATERLTRLLAGRYLRQSNVYNAVKHGLAVQAATATISLSRAGSPTPGFSAGGPAINLLEYRDTETHREWRQRTEWISVPSNLWLTHLALTQLQALWDVARAHYTGADITRIETVSDDAITAVLTGPLAPTAGIRNMTMTVATEIRPQ